MFRLSCCVCLAAIVWNVSVTRNLYVITVLPTLLYLVTGGWTWLKLVSKTIKRDVHFLKSGINIKRYVRKITKENILLSDLFLQQVKKNPGKLAYISADTGKALTFQESGNLAIKIANVFHAAGYKRGDTVALLMENRVEYMPVWIGVSMIGVVTSVINTNLRNDSLKHCIEICKCKGIIFSEEMSGAVKDIEKELEIDLYCFDTYDCDVVNVKYMEELMKAVHSSPPPKTADISTEDPLLYIYTSGTTGLPKAVIMRGTKLVIAPLITSYMSGISSDDVIYNALPQYHGNSIYICGNSIVQGTTCVIKKKFSASRYMEECCYYKATVINYIGETCRYLLAQPKRDADSKNTIRLALGNGLRASIWKEFQERFRIERIAEGYSATESNIGLMNTTSRVGAIGFNMITFSFLNVAKIIKVDKDTGEIIRGNNGLAVEAQPGEPGQIVGMMKKKPLLKFDGYLNKAATAKKIGRDIFVKGDSVFLSGDILMADEEGYFYFLDRTGDTFRWRGENVSTNEVEGVISKALQLVDVVVYGVEVPGEEGRGGMACIHDPDRMINVDELQSALEKALPRYARPIFLRMTSTIEVTGTFKLQKSKLRNEGFNISICSHDKCYYFSCKEKKYLPLNEDAYQKILTKQLLF